MSNTCLNNIAFITNRSNLSELERLYNDLEQISKSNNNFGILEETYEIINLGDNENYFFISTETPWTPKPDIWNKILENYNHIGYKYISEECGNSIFINTDFNREIFSESYIAFNFCDNAKENIIKSKLFKDNIIYDDFIYTTMRFNWDTDLINKFNNVLLSPIESVNDLIEISESYNLGFTISDYETMFS